MTQIKISPSMLASDFAYLADELEKCKKIGSELIHLDIMDGHFVPNITFGAPVVKCLKKTCDVPFDVHLMISDPLKYAEDFVKAGADIITFHIESDSDTNETIKKIKDLGCKVGLAIKPKTPAEAVLPYIDMLDMVLVMTVEPGFGGQSFMQDMMPKVRQVKAFADERKLDIDIQVDGGISPSTISQAAENGANVFVAGSAIFNSDNPQQVIDELKATARESII